MKKICLTALALALVFISMSSVGAEELRTTPFTSLWNDYKTMVPDGWKVAVDDEGTHYTNVSFKSPEPNYILSIRWYTRYATHMQVDGLLEMYSGPGDFVQQLSTWFSAGSLIEQVHEINIADRKAQRFMGRLARLPQGGPSYIVLARRARLGGVLVGDDEATSGGRQVWTVVLAPSGFYVLGYFAPEEGFAKYEKFYDRMVASFVPLKDGPGGAASPGTSLPVETADQKLQRYLSKIKLQRDRDKEPVCKEEFSVNNRGDVFGASRTVCRLFATVDLRKEIIEFVSTMKPAPAIPDQAQRYFIQGNTITKAAKNTADYNLAINKYKEALIEAPWWGDAYNNLAIALNSAGHADLAKQAMELYIFTKPIDAGQAQKKIYEIEAQQELQKERKKQFEQEVNLGVAAYGKGPDGYDEAIARWKKALELYPEQPEIPQVYRNLMQVYYDRKNWDETLKYIQKVLELTPDIPGINGRMGYVLDMRGDLPKACIYYKKACDLGFQVGCSNRLKRCP